MQGLDFAYESWGADRRLSPARAMRHPKRNVGARRVRSCISSSTYSGKANNFQRVRWVTVKLD